MFTLIVALIVFVMAFWNHTFFIVALFMWATCYLDKLLWDSYWQSKLKRMLDKYETEKKQATEIHDNLVKTNDKLTNQIDKSELSEITYKNELTRLRSENSTLLRKLGKTEALVEVQQREIERLNE